MQIRRSVSPQNRTPKETAAQAIVDRLAAENRRVLSDWRAVILLRRATEAIPPEKRRWTQAPANTNDILPVLRQMEVRGEIRRLDDTPGSHIYEVTVPYARGGLVEEHEVLMEVHPYAALSHLSALVFHDLTDVLPKELTVSIPVSGSAGMLPPGTDDKDWLGMVLVRGRQPTRVLDRPVRWIRLSPKRLFGIREYRPHGYPVRVTTPERTLLDCLQQPGLCGGFDNVLRAWIAARDTLDLDSLVHYVERFDVGILRQRVGFLLEELGLHHQTLERWQTQAKRGGSSKLLGSSPYAPTYSERWNLSINAPIGALNPHDEGAA